MFMGIGLISDNAPASRPVGAWTRSDLGQCVVLRSSPGLTGHRGREEASGVAARQARHGLYPCEVGVGPRVVALWLVGKGAGRLTPGAGKKHTGRTRTMRSPRVHLTHDSLIRQGPISCTAP